MMAVMAVAMSEDAKLTRGPIRGHLVSQTLPMLFGIASLVSAIVIERERLGPRRYVATLGVIFDRQRASGLLGAAGMGQRSDPMLLLPVTVSGGKNAGKKLSYHHVVEDLRTVGDVPALKPGAARIEAAGVKGDACAFLLQDRQTREIIGAGLCPSLRRES